MLEKDATTKNIFKPPILAYRKNKNIGDILTSAKCKHGVQNVGTKPCGHGRCQTCDHTSSDSIIKSNTGSEFVIRDQFNCATSCIIYAISCDVCNILYIGETCRQLNRRMGEHIRNIRKKIHLQRKFANDDDIGVSEHFNTSGHDISHMRTRVLMRAPYDTSSRKTLEKKIIFKLNSMKPHGLNKRD